MIIPFNDINNQFIAFLYADKIEFLTNGFSLLYLARENLAGSDPVIISY